jgi:hypothetical protein
MTSTSVPMDVLDRYVRPRVVRVKAGLSITRAIVECDNAKRSEVRFDANAFLTEPGYIFLPNRA